MIKVLIKKNNQNYENISIKGHAQADQFGKDLVCAGVSAIINGSLNGLDQLFQSETNLEVLDNEVIIKINNLSNKDIQLICEFMILQLKTIEFQYPKNITLKEVD
ncbi:ribosomal-processing cysteine protease Prp [Spiroplasma endosymbiont of Panorpa germanica]|uniref:ribosomal-processing cysteine protease Prp n=1 Tax=Spiroplasma endosymbiont of Panorpa germanica TaxID=3066314 RepID=UPI0030D36601